VHLYKSKPTKDIVVAEGDTILFGYEVVVTTVLRMQLLGFSSAKVLLLISTGLAVFEITLRMFHVWRLVKSKSNRARERAIFIMNSHGDIVKTVVCIVILPCEST
jgi:hypothetical protein